MRIFLKIRNLCVVLRIIRVCVCFTQIITEINKHKMQLHELDKKLSNR